MRAIIMKKWNSTIRHLLTPVAAVALLTTTAFGAVPGITGTGTVATFNLTAVTFNLNQPDGASVYAWGYGCSASTAPTFAPAAITTASCPALAGQVPGPTLIVTEGATVNVILTNNLPAAAGNTSILFNGFNVTATGGVAGLLTQEAAPAGTVTYSFTASTPGTRSYYSGTQSDLQVEMGLYGAIVVLPKNVPANCTGGLHAANLTAEAHWGEADFRLSQAAYDHPGTCYDREYLFQFAEMDPRIHAQVLAQVTATKGCAAGTMGCSLEVATEPYHPSYYLINGRSMPDDMDANFGGEYPHQPYNGNPHMHPGEQTLIRVIGQGRWQHPFHEHANHVRILGRDGNLILSSSTTPVVYDGTTSAQGLAGVLQFTTDTTPGQAFDGIFYFTGRGLNWDAYGHNPASSATNAKLSCTPDANGYNTGAPTAINFWEWCQDHNKPLEVAPFGDVNGGGPATLPNPNIFTNGAWYSGSPYLGPDATTRATGPTSSFQPSNVQANPANERGWAYMWHSHNEREITTNNVFPGGMLMMMLVDSREFVIDESN
jgi:FtsP/CotA-like multicopper oxidase with cupredoxin domain